ncbi:MAG: heme o synthase [bacterium]
MEAVLTRIAWRDWWQMGKPRLNGMVLLSALAGFALSPRFAVARTPLALFIVAFWLLAMSSSMLNMWFERDTDALMERTRERPLAAGRLGERHVFWTGQVLAALALSLFAAVGDWRTAGLGLLTWVSYLLVYTPLKRRTPLSLLAGSVTGALPPVMGWTAGGGNLDQAALGLFCLLFVWQVPHFLAIAALYGEQYKAAGIKVLGIVHGQASAGRQALLYAVALIPVSLWLGTVGLGGRVYEACALVLGLAFAGTALWAALRPSRFSARTLLLASVGYLPLLLSILVADRI